MAPIVRLENMSVIYGNGKEAVRGLNLAIEQGEVIGLLGPNGSGKTSTLSVIEGLLLPAHGRASVFELDPVVQREKIYSRMGVQLQEASYPIRIKVSELCGLFASFYDRPTDWRFLLNAFGLESTARRDVKTLSAGERQKLSLIIALIGRPELLILDEISTGLDPHARRMVQDSLKRIANSGTAMIIVTHYPNELQDLADRILVLNHGEQLFLGSPEEFCSVAGAENGTVYNTLEDAYLAVCSEQALQMREVIV